MRPRRNMNDMTDEDAKKQIEAHLWAAIDLMSDTSIQPDPRIWGHLMIYQKPFGHGRDDPHGQTETKDGT